VSDAATIHCAHLSIKAKKAAFSAALMLEFAEGDF
jgi:hypothetical protein